MARSFAEKFKSGSFGELIGLAHDAGKGRSAWQKYIREQSSDENATLEGKRGKIPHAIYGAKLAEEIFDTKGRFLSYCIAGHHSGLPDWSPATGAKSSLEFQLNQPLELVEIRDYIVSRIKTVNLPDPPWKFSHHLDLSLWIRMLYSCLVDADFLDTEEYMDHSRTLSRRDYPSIGRLLDRYCEYIEKFESISEKTEINKTRRKIRERCLKISKEGQGIFSLTVPTGGGKTLSSLGFALSHAETHRLDRIIYVIPYTSIIEQNTGVFRKVLGDDNVVEHHSNLNEDETSLRSRLACENWDAPFIVTTTVQFFESLFSAKASKCRKLHNIVNSVVIFDEAQLLPVEHLEPILETIQLLADRYNVTFVLSTATQPAFKEHYVGGSKFKGLKNVREIMENDVSDLYASLKRVNVTFPDNFEERFTWEEVAGKLNKYDQVLCIVSDRKSCRELHKLMPEGTYHLSALMCGEHRSRKINEIMERLKNGEQVRVISTQLIEAGVDIDFPVVYRSMSGLDSIAQAAGRCNREGKMKGPGEVVVFNGPKLSPRGILRKAEYTTRDILSTITCDPLDHEMFDRFFSGLYWKVNSLDKEGIIPILRPDAIDLGMSFRTASKKFHIIEDAAQKTIIVRYGESERIIDNMKAKDVNRFNMRKLQRFAVNVYNEEFNKMLKRGSIEEVQPGIFVMTSSLEYSDEIGLIVEENLYDPEEFIQ